MEQKVRRCMDRGYEGTLYNTRRKEVYLRVCICSVPLILHLALILCMWD